MINITISEIQDMINNYLTSPNIENIYKAWVSMYIVGDRVKSDLIMKRLKPIIKQQAEKYFKKFYDDSRPHLYRGVLLPPDFKISDYKIWQYDHVSFTEDKEVSEAFSTVNSQYGFVFPKSFKGYIIEYDFNPDEDFQWFNHNWSSLMNDEIFDNFVKFWNQKELILGKL